MLAKGKQKTELRKQKNVMIDFMMNFGRYQTENYHKKNSRFFAKLKH